MRTLGRRTFQATRYTHNENEIRSATEWGSDNEQTAKSKTSLPWAEKTSREKSLTSFYLTDFSTISIT